MTEMKKYYGVSTCNDHKTIGFLEQTSSIAPRTQAFNGCGICYWFDVKQKALDKTRELVSKGYSLHRIFDYQNYYTEKNEQRPQVHA